MHDKAVETIDATTNKAKFYIGEMQKPNVEAFIEQDTNDKQRIEAGAKKDQEPQNECKLGT